MTLRRFPPITVALVLVALVMAACGVPSSAGADRANDDDVPFGLLEETSSSSSRGGGQFAEIYTFDPDTGRLRSNVVEVDDTSLGTVLRRLQEVPGDEPAAAGNPLADTDAIGEIALNRGQAEVELTEAFSEMSGTNSQVVALAEIVFTATGRADVAQVIFVRDGQPLPVLDGEGSLTDDPLTRSDFLDLAPL